MNGTKTRLMLYRFTKVIIAILIIPTLLLGILCTIVMSNTRLNGGIPSIFGYYAVQIPNNNFYNSQLNRYKAGDYYMFQSISSSDYKVGDMISYYAGAGLTEDLITIERVEWIETLSARLPETKKAINKDKGLSRTEPFYDNLQKDSYTLLPGISYQSFLYNNSLNTVSNYDASELPASAEVGLGRIEKTGIGYDDKNNTYAMFLVYESPTDLVNIPVLALNVIGHSIDSSPFFINLLLYSSTTLSFVVMLLFPCALIITFQVTNLSLVVKQIREGKTVKKKLIREAEIKNQQEEFSATKPLPTESNEFFAGLLKGGGGRAGSLRSGAKVYNKEELEKIRNELLSNKKYDSEFDEDENEARILAEKQKAEKAEVGFDKTKLAKDFTPEIKSSKIRIGIADIPESIVETYGLKVKDKRDSNYSIPPIPSISSMQSNDISQIKEKDSELSKIPDFSNKFGFEKTTDSKNPPASARFEALSKKPSISQISSTDINQNRTNESQKDSVSPKLSVSQAQSQSKKSPINQTDSELLDKSDLRSKFGFEIPNSTVTTDSSVSPKNNWMGKKNETPETPITPKFDKESDN